MNSEGIEYGVMISVSASLDLKNYRWAKFFTAKLTKIAQLKVSGEAEPALSKRSWLV